MYHNLKFKKTIKNDPICACSQYCFRCHFTIKTVKVEIKIEWFKAKRSFLHFACHFKENGQTFGF